jgi:outer membrane immunogenic protein
MRRSVAWALALLPLVGGWGTASAADMAVKALPPPVVAAVYNWTGFYVGVNGGYGWEGSTGDLVGNSAGLGIPGAIAGGTIPRALNVQPAGWIGGAQAGYNWQWDHIVLGVEADIQATGIKQSLTIPLTGLGLLPTLSTGSSELDWFGTVRGRVGYAWNQFMVYGTGGLAYGYVSDRGSVGVVAPPPIGIGTSASTRTGWAAGGGFEWAFQPSWSVKGEYLHVDLGSVTSRLLFATSPTDFLDYRFNHTYDIVRVGLNYKFGPSAVVAKY